MRRLPQPGLPEPAPFALRLQGATDLAAARFGLLAWQNPFARDGPASAFWTEASMADAMAVPDAVPLVGMAAAGEAEVAGLRTGDGTLVLKIERYGAAMQVRIRGGGAFPENGGLALLREVVRIEDLWNGFAVPAPRSGRGWGRGSRTCVNGGGIMHHAERSGGPVAAAQNCATHGPLLVVVRGRRCTAWSSMRRFDWRLLTRG